MAPAQIAPTNGATAFSCRIRSDGCGRKRTNTSTCHTISRGHSPKRSATSLATECTWELATSTFPSEAVAARIADGQDILSRAAGDGGADAWLRPGVVGRLGAAAGLSQFDLRFS